MKEVIPIEITASSKSWPFIEARRILENINNKTPEKGFVLFETGYGPSGLPHIGTFGEVVKTTFVVSAFQAISDIPTKIICFSDDMDGLRKIPTNLPNQEMLQEHIKKPLSAIPDPFGTHDSYGYNMNARLQKFLDQFGFNYEFVSATDCYKSGKFNDVILKVLKNYDAIMGVIIPTLGSERATSYSPILPICQKTGKVLENGLISYDMETGNITYRGDDGQEQTGSALSGGCKLQWKTDFGARWHALDVDYEIYGKDIIPSAELASKVCGILGDKKPINFHYELFLDENGQKISKSKGNGLSMDEWLRYAPAESLALFNYAKPKTAKRLYFDIIPKTTDEYMTHLMKYHDLPPEKQLDSPVWYIHEGNPPQLNFGNISFSLLLNLASACNPENDDILWGFISKYSSDLQKGQNPFFDKLVSCAINYYEDFVKVHKQYRDPTDVEKQAMVELRDILAQDIAGYNQKTAEEIQTLVYDIGNKYEFELKLWFSALYEVLLGCSKGPRMGSFIKLYGVEETIALINKLVLSA